MPFPPRVAGVLLAAGLSTRMGRPKALEPLLGRPLCLYAATTLVNAGYESLWAVIPPGEVGERLRTVLAPLPFQFITALQPERGLLASFQNAAPAFEQAGAVVFTLADMPLVAAETHRALGECWARQRPPAIVTAYGDGVAAPTTAPPTLLSAALLPRLLALPSADQGPRPLLRELGAEVVHLRRPARELLDVDTPAALAQAERELRPYLP